jgi:anti-sigma regulatory factor (Ser/Thr protein kinase)
LLPRTRRAIAEYLRETGATDEQLDDIVLAVDEACGNVVRHAYRVGDVGEYRLAALISDDEVSIAVEDDGVGLPDEVVDITDATGAVSGRGLDIIRHVMTTVELHSPTKRGVGTEVRMCKLLTHQS